MWRVENFAKVEVGAHHWEAVAEVNLDFLVHVWFGVDGVDDFAVEGVVVAVSEEDAVRCVTRLDALFILFLFSLFMLSAVSMNHAQ